MAVVEHMDTSCYGEIRVGFADWEAAGPVALDLARSMAAVDSYSFAAEVVRNTAYLAALGHCSGAVEPALVPEIAGWLGRIALVDNLVTALVDVASADMY